MSRSHKEIEEAFEEQKQDEYDLIKYAGFDSAEIWELWYDSDDDVESFIEYLHKLEAEGLARADEMEEDNGL